MFEPSVPFTLYAVVIVVAVFFLAVLLLQWLWNITMPDVFGVKHVTYGQAFRILLIATILFGGPMTG